MRFDAERDRLDDVIPDLGPDDLIVNCIGVIKHLIDDDDPADRLRAIELNAAFPHRLEAAARARGARVLQIATDCVFSGRTGGYDESSPHDEGDVYGRTKSLGEVASAFVMHVRASIIGRELSTSTSLQDWVLSHAPGSVIGGYTDHHWNGVTTDAFADVALAVADGAFAAGTTHLVPADQVTKAELCELILEAHGRTDVEVEPRPSGHPVDRTLRTLDPAANNRLWAAAGFGEPPTVAHMVRRAAAGERGEAA